MNKGILKCFIRTLLLVSLICMICGCKKNNSVPVQLAEDAGRQNDGTQTFAVINIKDYGKMRFRLLDKNAPGAVAKFTEMAESGYFNNKSIYMAINDFCFIAGSASDESAWVNTINTDNNTSEIDPECYPVKGALCYTESSADNRYKASNFTVIQAGADFIAELEELLEYKKVTLKEYFKQAYGKEISDDDLKIFKKYGGAPWLYGHCIVFGQLIEGEDVLDRICSCEVTDDSGFEPIEEIMIENIIIER